MRQPRCKTAALSRGTTSKVRTYAVARFENEEASILGLLLPSRTFDTPGNLPKQGDPPKEHSDGLGHEDYLEDLVY